MRKAVFTTALVVSLVALGHAPAVRAQGWSVDVSAGRLVYDPLSANVGTNNLMAGVHYDARRDAWVYGTAGVPTGGNSTVWGAGGTGLRVSLPATQSNGASFGADLGVHGFSFRDRLANELGTGGSLDAVPFARVAAGAGFFEARGGWRGQLLSFAGVREKRAVFETGVRGGYGTSVRVEGDAKWVRATEGTYPFVGATVSYEASKVQLWGQLGKWLATDLDERTWGAGSGVTLGTRTTVWGSVRQEAPDPLYWNESRRTWSVGLTQRLGRVTAPLVPILPAQAGTVVVQIAATDAPAGAVLIAGDFNNWQPTPMLREGGFWIVRLSLGAGVYHYAFRSVNGDWFVPSSTAGRREDGMGGYVAVLIVS